MTIHFKDRTDLPRDRRKQTAMDVNDAASLGMSPTGDSFDVDVDAEFENVFLRDDTALADGDAQDPLDGLAGMGAAADGGSSLLPSPGSIFALSPGLGGLPAGGASQYAPANAVQMEMQENARLPTFNMAVDRSNAISPTRVGLAMRQTGGSRGRSNSYGRLHGLGFGAAPVDGAVAATGRVSDVTSRDVDEILRLSENDSNLTEIFLGGSDRQSQSLAYSSSAGELLGTIGSRIGDKLDNIGTNDQEPQNDPVLTAVSSSDAMDILAAMDDVNDDDGPSNTADIPSSKKMQSGKPPSSTITTAQSLPVGKGISHSVGASRPLARSTGVKRKGGPGKDSSSMQSPYGRRVQLPIPTPTSTLTKQTAARAGNKPNKPVAASASPSSDSSMAAAIATAAKLATMAPRPQPGKSVPPTKSKQMPSTTPIAAAPSGKTPSTVTRGRPTPVPSSQGVPPPPYPPYPHPGAKTPYNQTQQAKFAAAHASAKVSLTEAAKKRSQFGFGSHHVVPSVPMPMPNAAIGRPGATFAGAAGKAPLAGNKRPLIPPHPTAPRPPMPVPPHIAQQQAAAAAAAAAAALAHKNRVNKALSNQAQLSSANSGPAYERKKQRAKDARQKLNEAIDCLSVAISLAGSQSVQRAQRLSSDAMKPPAFKGGGQDAQNCPIQTFRPTTVKIMQAMGRTADQAKKWERPSFVGSASEMVQGLNAQCDALMQELVVMNRLYREEVSKNGGNEANVAQEQKDEKLSLVPVVSEGSHGETSPTAGQMPCLAADTVQSSPCKKRKLSSATSLDALSTVLQEKRIRETFVAFLDPKSLLRCRQVCDFWSNDAMFGADDPWLTFLLKRFGFANVRKWQDKDDEEEEHRDPTSFALYRRMSEAIARPASLYEGNIRLGHGSISGAIGAWATIVERSNGETLRSVRKQQSSANTGGIAFASLPVIEVRLLLQNVGISDCSIMVPDQTLEVDASTRRRGETFSEITFDPRLSKKLIAADGTTTTIPSSASDVTNGPDVPEMFRLGLFESTVLVAYIYAKSCTTTTKFRRRANSINMLVNIRGITSTLVVPFKKSEGIDDDHSSTSGSVQTKPDHPMEIVVKK